MEYAPQYNKVKRIMSLIAGICAIVTGSLFVLSAVVGLASSLDGFTKVFSLVQYTAFGIVVISNGAVIVKKPIFSLGKYERQKKNRILLIVFTILCLTNAASSVLMTVLMPQLLYADYDALLNMDFENMFDTGSFDITIFTFPDITVFVLELMVMMLAFVTVILVIVSMALKSGDENYVQPVSRYNNSAPHGLTSSQTANSIFMKSSTSAPVVNFKSEAPETNNKDALAENIRKTQENELGEKMKKLNAWKEQGIITQEQYEIAMKKVMDQFTE